MTVPRSLFSSHYIYFLLSCKMHDLPSDQTGRRERPEEDPEGREQKGRRGNRCRAAIRAAFYRHVTCKCLENCWSQVIPILVDLFGALDNFF